MYSGRDHINMLQIALFYVHYVCERRRMKTRKGKGEERRGGKEGGTGGERKRERGAGGEILGFLNF